MRTILVWASLVLTGCAASLSSQQPPPKLSTGFWFWTATDPGSTLRCLPVDVIFVHVGDISKEPVPLYLRKGGGPSVHWNAWAVLPDELPAAKEYWLVWRYRNQGVPDVQVAPMVAENFARVSWDARKRGLNIAGIQLDIDSPTASLAEYAGFLRDLRKELRPEAQVSITALFDWFRPGTKIGDVVAAVDEFVPQFYDAGPPDRRDGAIAVTTDPEHWGPVFNHFGKRFRIGISTFGRSRFVPKNAASYRYYGLLGLPDLTPLDIAANPTFQMETERTKAGELMLTYRAMRTTKISYTDFAAGDALQFTLPTAEAVRSAVAGARQMGGNLAGIVFFRWPTGNETMAMQPDEVLEAAGILKGIRKPSVEAVDGHCAAVSCVDLYFEGGDANAAGLLRYRIASSAPLEYFLPEKTVPVRMTGASLLELSLPPFTGRGRIYLGRAVSAKPSAFTVVREP
jgi:hypothetical protein